MDIKGKFFIARNRDISAPFECALLDRSWVATDNLVEADFLLLDYEAYAYEDKIRFAHENHKPIFIYPHSVIAEIIWDGLYEPTEVACNFVYARGQQKVMDTYGYPYRTEVIGWPLTPILPMKAAPSVIRKVLFAPRHPNPMTGHMHPIDRHGNLVAMRTLKKIEYLSRLTVRYCGELKNNHLGDTEGDRITLQQIRKPGIDMAAEAIEDGNDVVVSWGTFAYLSVALGVPTIMYNQDRPHNNMRETNNWRKYQQFRHYPMDLADPKIFERVKVVDPVVLEWRENFIGKPFDGDYFVDIIEEVLTDYRT